MRLVCFVAAMVACGVDDANPTLTDTTTTDSGTTDSGTGHHTNGPVADLSGTILLDGSPMVGADTRLCRGTQCRYETTDAAGLYTFANLPPDKYSLEIVPAADSGLATWFAPVVLAADDVRTLDLSLLPYEDIADISATSTEYPVGTGLYVTLSSSAIEPALAIAEPATEVGGVRVPESLWTPFDGVTGTVLAVWFVDPFDFVSVSPSGLPLRIDNEWAFVDGTTLEVYVGSYGESAWVSAGTATAAGASLTGAALPVIGTVILVQP